MHYRYFPVGVQSAKQSFSFFLKFGFATGRVWREKNVFFAFLPSHTKELKHQPFLVPRTQTGSMFAA